MCRQIRNTSLLKDRQENPITWKLLNRSIALKLNSEMTKRPVVAVKTVRQPTPKASNDGVLMQI
jgi:hypothetical protein